MPRKLSLEGKIFGRLIVISEESKRNKRKEVMWLCRCSCGGSVISTGRDIKRGHTRSCGCLQREKAATHRLSHVPLYNVWVCMLARCENEKNISFKNYGGRGISVCTKWHEVKCFIEWALCHGYEKSLQIDRIDNNGNYEPENCHFVTASVNANNKRTNLMVNIDGEEMTLSQACTKYGASYDVAIQRIQKLGWNSDDAIKRPTRKAKGVSWSKNRNHWVAYSHIGGKQKYIGSFKTESEAIMARQKSQNGFSTKP